MKEYWFENGHSRETVTYKSDKYENVLDCKIAAKEYSEKNKEDVTVLFEDTDSNYSGARAIAKCVFDGKDAKIV